LLNYVWRYYVQTVRSALPVDITTDFPLYRLSALLCSVWRYIRSDYPMCSTLPGDATHAYSLYNACRYDNRLSALPAIRFALSSDILQPTICCALLYLATLHSTIRFTMPGDIPTDCPLSRLSALSSDMKQPAVHYSVCSFYKRLSNLPTIRSDLYGDTINNFLLSSTLLAILQPTICGALFCLASLQLAIRAPLPVDITTDYPFYRLSAPLCMATLQPTILCIRSDMSGDTTNDYLLYSTMSRDTTSDCLRCFTLSGDTISDYLLCSTLFVDMLVGGLVCGLVGVSG
jgi:hypothetical protein